MDNESRIAEQAAEYYVRSRMETAVERRTREAWLAEDARHRRAYDDMRRLWDCAGDLRDDADLKALQRRHMATLRASRWFRSGWILASAATLALVLVGIYVMYFFDAPATPVSYVTQLGERRTETLVDGTRLVLNTDSALEASYTRGRRAVTLQRGEAQFDVAHDAARPFVVTVDGSTVTALGTRFQVRRDAGEAVVTLLDGAVELAQGSQRHTLRPYEQARVSTGGGIAVASIDPERITGWVDGWLRFRRTPLAEVVAEANRYSARKLRLGDPALAGIELNGSFRAGDSASIASSVALMLPVRVEDGGADIVLLPK